MPSVRALLPVVALTLVACGTASPGPPAWNGAWRSAQAEMSANHGAAPTPAGERRAAALALLAGHPEEAQLILARAVAAHPEDGWLRHDAAWAAAFRDDAAGLLVHGAAAVEALPPTAPERAALVALMRSEGSWAASWDALVEERLGAELARAGRGQDSAFAEEVRWALWELAQRRDDVGVMDRIGAELGVLTQYRAVAPLGSHGAESLHERYAPETDGRAPFLDTSHWDDAGWGRSVSPFERRFRDGELFFPDTHEGGAGYGEAWFHTDSEGEVLVAVETPAAAKVWVDGAPALEVDTLHRSRGSSARARIQLGPGDHRVLVKVVHRGAGAWARVRVWSCCGAPEVTVDSAVPADATGPSARRAMPAVLPAPPSLLERMALAPLDGERPEGLYRYLGRWFVARRRPFRDRGVEQETLGRLLALAPRCAWGWVAQGLAHVAAPDVPADVRRSRSRSAFREAARIHEDAAVLTQLAAVDQADGRLEEALSKVDRALQLDPDHLGALLVRLELLVRRGWRAESAAAYDALVARRLSDTAFRAALRYDRQAGRWERARALLARWQKSAPGLVADAAATVAWAAGDYGGAAEALSVWARHDAGGTKSFQKRIHLLRLLGDAAGEKEALEERVRARPDDAWADRQRATRAALDGDAEAAAERLRALLARRPDMLPLRELLAELAGTSMADLAAGEGAAQVIAEYEAAAAAPGPVALWSRFPGVDVLRSVRIFVLPDGGSVQTERVLRRVQSKQLADAIGEFTPPAGSVLLEARTLRADGTVREPELDHGKGALSFSGLTPGDYTEVTMLRFSPSARRTGGMVGACSAGSWGLPTFRLECRVAARDDVPVDIQLRNGMPVPEERRENGNVVRRWRFERMAPIRPEPQAASPGEFVPHAAVRWGEPAARDDAWRTLTRSWRAALRPLLRPSEEITRLAEALGRGRDDAGRLRAAYSYVRDEIAQGDPAGKLHTSAAATLAARKGNPHVLLLALLRELGLRPELMLCRPQFDAQLTGLLPSSKAVWYPLVYVAGAEPAWLDLNDRFTPYGHVREGLGGAPCLAVLEAPGEDAYGVVRPPLDVTGPDGWSLNVELELDEAGAASGRVSVTGRGLAPANLRRGLGAGKESERRTLVEHWLRDGIPGVRVESLTFEGLENPDEDFVFIVDVSAPNVAERRGHGWEVSGVFAGQLGGRLSGVPALADYARLAQRTTPLRLAPCDESLSLVVRAPSGARFTGGPVSTDLRSDGARFVQRVEMDGAVLRLERSISVSEGRVSAPRFPIFLGFVAATRDASARPIQLSR